MDAQFMVRSRLPWRTIETTHFAFHYPAELESWTRDLASHIEAVDSAVAQQVGYAPTGKTDVVVDDPYGYPNGSAWPFLDRPVVNLWATPPGPRDDIGEFRDWGATLISHEFTHIAHLTRPSRNPLERRLWEALPVDIGPISIAAPRWVIEGYATYVEGRVTGSGRPHGVWRPAFLRQWALEGQLPRYDQLDSWGAYNGGEFAYLAGSAFLEWLVQRQGDSSLVHLWRRMSARQTRSFEDAFTGVFGESAPILYGRFTADLTANALSARQIIRAASAPGDSGSIVQRLTWDTGDPAMSPDGRHVAIVLRSPVARSRVVIWSTAAEPDTGKARRDSLLIASDPGDVPARPIFPPPKRAIATLRSPGSSYDYPRFLRDGRVLLVRSTPRGDGSASPDLYLWNPSGGSVRRITKNAGLREADPTPDGHSAVATRCHAGWCDLVMVSLVDGSIRLLVPGAATHSFYRPRMSPAGTNAVVSIHDGQRWRLALVDVRTAAFAYLPVRDTANHYDAAWEGDGRTIVDVSDQGGVPNIERIDLSTSHAYPMTHVSGAAVAPEPDPADGSIWFLSLYSRGYDLRSVHGIDSTSLAATLPAGLTPAAPMPVEARPPLPVNKVSSPHPYGMAPRSFRWIPQPQADADGASVALGLESMDLIGRSELRLTGSLGDASAWRGGALALAWHGAPAAVRFDLFDAEQRPEASRSPVPRAFDLDSHLAGGLFSIGGTTQLDSWAARYELGGSLMAASTPTIPPSGEPTSSSTRALLFGDGGATWVQRGDQSAISESVAGNVTTGRAFDTGFSRALVTAGLGVGGYGPLPLSVAGTYGRTSANTPPFEQFALGGSPSPIIDRPVLTQRVAMPVLPEGIAMGTSVLTYRVTVSTQPLSWFWWAGSAAPAGDRFSRWQRVIGAEWTQSIAAIPLAGTPAARAQIGVGESLDRPFQHRVRAYINLILDP